MNRKSLFLSYATLLTTTILLNSTAIAKTNKTPQNPSNNSSRITIKGIMDLSVLPVINGTIVQYIPSPYGHLDGLLLRNGEQVIFSSSLGEAVKRLVHPGQDIIIRGLKAYKLPLIQAFSIGDQNGHIIEEDSLQTSHFPIPTIGPDYSVSGTIKTTIHNLQGQINGVILNDTTVIYIQPSDANNFKTLLTAGKTIYAKGAGSNNSLGKAIQARVLGTNAENLVTLDDINAPPPGPPAGSPTYDNIRQ